MEHQLGNNPFGLIQPEQACHGYTCEWIKGQNTTVTLRIVSILNSVMAIITPTAEVYWGAAP